MEQEKSRRFKLSLIFVKVLFWTLLLFWLFVCVFVANTTDENYRFNDYTCKSFNDGWVLADAEEIPVTIPGKIRTSDSVVRIRNVIPEGIDDRTTIMVKSLHQNIVVRVSGEVVATYDDSDTRSFGFHSPSAYMLIPVSSEDAGKPIEIKYSAPEPEVAGQLNDIRIGSDIGILCWMLESYGNDVIFAFLLLYTGIVIALFGAIMQFTKYENPNMNITYLGVTAICTAIWMLGEGRLKQFYYGNLALGEMLLWECLFVAPIPMLFYVNRLQERRYNHIYIVGSTIGMVINIGMLILELTNTMDFYDMYKAGWAIILGSGAIVIYTIIRDCLKGIYQWKLLVGILLLLLCVVLQMWSFLHSTSGIFPNNYISFGFILFMMIMAISAINSLQKQKQEQILAIKANETKTSFLANMSHEIRTPINAILGFNEMILREETNEQINEYAANIKKASKTLLILVNDILDFSKVESGKVDLTQEDYQISGMLTDVINLTYIKAQEKGLSFDIDVQKDIPRTLYGDEMRVKQILTNILNNAVKYTETGTVSLKVRFDKRRKNTGVLRIVVKDTGIGIEQENISKITESFQRFDLQHNRSIEGTGLGMSIVAHLLKAMGGTMQISSRYGKGSEFRIQIPQGIRDATPIGNYQMDYRQELRNQMPYQALFTAPQAKILFVDDNFMNLSVLKGLLKKTKIQIDTAESGMKCLEMTREKKYDLIFMDHLMPEMDGVETLKRLRQETDNPNRDTIVLALTANAIKGLQDFYIQEGFYAYLTKPIDWKKLEELLLKLLPDKYIIPYEADESDAAGSSAAGPERTDTEQASIEDCTQEWLSMWKDAHINLAAGYHYCGGSLGQFHWLLMVFAKNFGNKFRTMLTYYQEADMENYTIEVHALKSNAKTLGADTLYQLAWEHEQQSRAGNWDYIQEHWDELCQECYCVVNGILNYMGEEPMNMEEVAATEEVSETGFTDEQRIILKNSLSMLRDYETEPVCSMLEELLAGDLPEQIKERLEQAIEELNHLRFDEAERILKQLQGSY